MVIYKGAVLASWGDVEARYICHSIRKSLLSGLYGAAIEDKTINPKTTLSQLSIDDIPPTLSYNEKRATIADLLKARSGVYHKAAAETVSMKRKRPERESHKAGTYFYYNNWDFNALGTIYSKLTEKDIFVAFDQVFAQPLHMQDYLPSHGKLCYERDLSIHPAYHFRMSARDLARFGLLYARGGIWDGVRIIPRIPTVGGTVFYGGFHPTRK
jgi:CubicO group peptidase (beta-lactamase class C family)